MKHDMEQFKADFIERIKNAQSVVIASHPTPDEDSMGSALAMRSLVFKHAPDATVRVVYAEEVGTRWEGLLGFEQVEGLVDMDTALNGADTLIIVDANNYHRVGISDMAWNNFNGQTLCIDHHEKNESEFDLSYIDHEATSVAELLYYIFYKDDKEVSREISDLLLLGIMGDTGMLSFINRENAHVLFMVHRLISEGGADIVDLQYRYFRHSIKSLDILRNGFSNISIHDNVEGGTCFALYISSDIYERTGLSVLEVKHMKDYLITNYSGMFKGVAWGFIVYPDADGVPNISFRSRHDSVDVREMIETLGLKGGGHAWASGAEFAKNPGDVETAFETLINRLKEKKIIA